MLELQVTPQFRLGYSYDYDISDIARFSNGTHELMLKFEWNDLKNKFSNSRLLFPKIPKSRIDCPKYF